MMFLREMIHGNASTNSDRGGGIKNIHSNSNKDLEQLSASMKTLVPFASFSQYPADPFISQKISELNPSVESLRSSSNLKTLLATIINCVIKNEQAQNYQIVKVRLDLLMKLLVSQLCVPPWLSLIGVGRSVPLQSHSSVSGTSMDLQGAMLDILVDTFSLLKYTEDLLRRGRSDSALDSNRVMLFFKLMQFRCTPLLPHSITVKECAPAALEQLSCHLLSVTAATHSIKSSIKLVVNRLSNCLNNESGSFAIAERQGEVEAIVMDYWAWLRTNQTALVRLCRKEEIVTSVDASLRAWLREECYSSPAELVSVYRQKYRAALTHMAVPLQPYRTGDVSQALKDLLRERASLNKCDYVGGVPAELAPKDGAQDLVSVRRSSSVPGGGCRRDSPVETMFSVPLCRAVRKELRKVVAYLFEIDRFGQHPAGQCSAHYHTDLACSQDDSCATDESDSSSVGSPSTVGLLEQRCVSEGQQKDSRGAAGQVDSDAEWQTDLLDLLCTYTLLAASRTFAAGDAFWILSDLYGGDGLVLCPLAADDSGGRTAQRAGFTATVTGHSVDCSTVSIAITAAGAKVTLKERYGLYLQRDLEACTTRRADMQPVGRFECTTTSLIVLAATADGVDTGSADNTLVADGSDSAAEKLEACYSLYKNLFINPERICRRAVSIEPFI